MITRNIARTYPDAWPRGATVAQRVDLSTRTRVRFLFFAELLIGGYLAFGRLFAHAGIAPFYPAELFLSATFVFGGAAWLQLYFRQLGSGMPAAVMSAGFFGWGLIEVIRGILAGYSFLESMRGLATHYYVFLFFIGWELAPRTDVRWFLRMLRRTSAAVVAGGLLTAALSHYIGDGPLGVLLSPPAMPAYTGTALLAFAPALGPMFYPLFGGTIATLLLNPGRAAWLSMIAGGFLASFAAGPVVRRRLLILAIAFAVLIVAIGPLLPVTEGRGGTLSPQWLMARMATLVDPDAAEQMIAADGTSADVAAIRAISGTKEWRKRFWQATFDSLDAEGLWLTGHGYGFSLGTLIGIDVHTPHNFAVYLLGYTGCVGLALYLGLILAFAGSFLSLPRSPFRPFLIGQLAATLIVASFGNGLETPFVAVPFYLVMGLAYGLARAQAGVADA